MFEPERQSATQSQSRSREGGDLWKEAPAWRNLSFVAVGLTIAAVILALPPLMQPAATSEAASVAQVAVQAAPPATPPSGGGSVLAQAAAPPSTPTIPPTIAPALVQQAAPLPAHSATAPIQTASMAPRNGAAMPRQPYAQQSAPQALSDQQRQACLLQSEPAPQNAGTGTVVSFEDHSISMARIALAQASFKGLIDPAYIDNLRVVVRMANGSSLVLLVPKSMTVHPGDRVMAQTTYRNLNLACNYIPNLITTDMGPAPQVPGAPPPPAQP